MERRCSRLILSKSTNLSILTFLILFFIQSFLRRLGEGNYATLTFIAYMLSGYILLKLTSPQKTKPLLIVLLPYIISIILVSLLDQDFTGFFLMLPVFAISSIFLFVFAYSARSGTYKIKYAYIVVILLISAILWPFQENYSNWLISRNNPKISEYYDFNFVNSNNQLQKSTSSNLNVYLFTSAHCGSCIHEYPYYSEIAMRYSSDSSISFHSVFLSFMEKDSLYYNELKQDPYAFSWATTKDTDKIYSNLKMHGVPYLLVVNRQGRILYNGYCRIRPWVFINSIDRIIANNKEPISAYS